MATSLAGHGGRGGSEFMPGLHAPAHRPAAVRVSDIPTTGGLMLEAGAGIATAVWSVTRPTTAQRIAWGVGLTIVSAFGVMEGHGWFRSLARGVFVGAPAALGLEAARQVKPPSSAA